MEEFADKIYLFDGFKLDISERLLFDGEKAIPLPPKVFDTLAFLAGNSGKLVRKEKMLESIWEESFVEENNLAQNISYLRRILRENSENKFIETVPKLGYRFVSAVTVVENGDAGSFTDTVSELISAHTSVTPHVDGFQPPATQYVQNGDVNIAYQVIGSGDVDIVFVMGWVSHLEYFWKEPRFAAFLERLGSFSRLILFDKRGTGLSDRVPVSQLPTLEQRMEDVHAVMDAVGSEKAVLVGVSEGGPMCTLFAATYPERTSGLVMIGTYAKRIKDEDYPWGVSAKDREKFFDEMMRDWGKPVGIKERAPSLANDAEFCEWWAEYLRNGASPGAAVALTKMNAEIDVRNVLPLVRVPTLVIHRKGDLCLQVEEGRYVAELIPNCKYVEFEGIDHLPFVGNQLEVLDEIEEFVTGIRSDEEIDRVLATVLFIKIINSNEKAAGNAGRQDSFEKLGIFVRRQIRNSKGKIVSYDETELLAVFDGPARAIRCALVLNESAKRMNLRIKTGIHTGECDVFGEEYSGIAVELAKKIAEESNESELLASRTVKDLVAGSGIDFEEFGMKSFDEMTGEWRLFTVK